MIDVYKSSIKFKKVNIILTFILLTGIFIRLYHFLSNRSLWLDEVYLSSGLLKMNYHALVQKPLDYQQKAPIGFLFSVKFFINLFGKNEYALRIVPFITGTLSMFFFIPVARFFLKSYGVILALMLFAFAPAIIYHTVEIKQYSNELFCTVLAFYFLIRYKSCTTYRQAFCWGICGAVLLWFSYSVIFILAGFGIALSSYEVFKKNWNILFIRMIPFSMWLLSFLINYFLFVDNIHGTSWVVYWFNFYGNFMPLPPKSIADLNWFFVNFYRMLDYPMGLLWNFIRTSPEPTNIWLKMPVLPVFLMCLGFYALYKFSKQQFLIVIFPVVLVFFASGLKHYPLTERFWVFIMPIFIILLAKGFDYIKFSNLKMLLFFLIVLNPLYQSFSSVLQPEKFYKHKKSFQKEMFNFINNHFIKDDAVYVYWNELPGYRVYKNLYEYKYSAIEGQDFRKVSQNFADYDKHLESDFVKFKGKKRVWLLFNHKYLANVGDMINDPSWYYQSGFNPTKNVENEFLKIGKQVKKVTTADVTVCLYELKNTNP